MSRLNNPFVFWSGLLTAIGGLVLVYFGVDLPNTNLQTFVYPELIGGGLLIIGCALVGVGLIRMLLGWVGKKL